MAQLAMTSITGPGSLPSRQGSPVRLIATADLATLRADLTRRRRRLRTRERHTQAIDHALTQLAKRRLTRNPELRDTG